MEKKDRELRLEEAINKTSDRQDAATINLLVHDLYEAQIERSEKNAKRWFVLCLVLIGTLIFTNIGWLYYESQYDSVVVTQDAHSGEGDANVIGAGVGNLIFGGSEPADANATTDTSEE